MITRRIQETLEELRRLEGLLRAYAEARRPFCIGLQNLAYVGEYEIEYAEGYDIEKSTFCLQFEDKWGARARGAGRTMTITPSELAQFLASPEACIGAWRHDLQEEVEAKLERQALKEEQREYIRLKARIMPAFPVTAEDHARFEELHARHGHRDLE